MPRIGSARTRRERSPQQNVSPWFIEDVGANSVGESAASVLSDLRVQAIHVTIGESIVRSFIEAHEPIEAREVMDTSASRGRWADLDPDPQTIGGRRIFGESPDDYPSLQLLLMRTTPSESLSGAVPWLEPRRALFCACSTCPLVLRRRASDAARDLRGHTRSDTSTRCREPQTNSTSRWRNCEILCGSAQCWRCPRAMALHFSPRCSLTLAASLFGALNGSQPNSPSN